MIQLSSITRFFRSSAHQAVFSVLLITSHFSATGWGAEAASVPSATVDAAPSTLREEALAALGTHDPTARMAKFLTLLGSLKESDAGELRKLWQELILIGRNDQEIEPHLNRTIARLLGAKVLESRRDVSLKASWLVNATKQEVEGAMVTDPQGVRKWYDSLTNEPLREALLDTYAASMAESSKAEALRVLDAVEPEFQAACGKTIIRRLLHREGFAEISKWLGSAMQLKEGFSPSAKKHLLNSALDWMAGNPAAAPQLATALEPVVGESFVEWDRMNILAKSYAKADEKAAAAWAHRIAARLPGDAGTKLMTSSQQIK